MKIAEKLATKSRLGPRTRQTDVRSRSVGETPVTVGRYAGTQR
jgi:hypothetical protein